jgi:hypothetical protein
MIYMKVFQPKDYPLIEIELSRLDHPMAGYIAAHKGVYSETGQPAPAYIYANISHQGEVYTPDEAREISDLWHIAAKTAETLDLMVKSRDDLARPIAARMQIQTVVLDWIESKE